MVRLNGSFTEDQKTEFDAVGKELELSTQSQILGVLLDSHHKVKQLEEKIKQLEEMANTSQLKLTSDEEELVEKAVSYSGMSKDELTKRGLIAEAKKAVSLATRQATLDEADPEDLKKMTFAGVAAARIQQVIEKIMNYNDSQPEKQNKFFISPSLVFKLTGSNRKAINEFFNKYQNMIDDHNNKHSLGVEDNRKGKGIDAKEMIGI